MRFIVLPSPLAPLSYLNQSAMLTPTPTRMSYRGTVGGATGP